MHKSQSAVAHVSCTPSLVRRVSVLVILKPDNVVVSRLQTRTQLADAPQMNRLPLDIRNDLCPVSAIPRPRQASIMRSLRRDWSSTMMMNVVDEVRVQTARMTLLQAR